MGKDPAIWGPGHSCCPGASSGDVGILGAGNAAGREGTLLRLSVGGQAAVESTSLAALEHSFVHCSPRHIIALVALRYHPVLGMTGA